MLAFNGYPFLKWLKIAKDTNIRSQIFKVKYKQNPTKMGRQLNFVKVTYSLFPELAYVLLRLAGIVFRLKSRK
jgi:hypothetical protein